MYFSRVATRSATSSFEAPVLIASTMSFAISSAFSSFWRAETAPSIVEVVVSGTSSATSFSARTEKATVAQTVATIRIAKNFFIRIHPFIIFISMSIVTHNNTKVKRFKKN